MAHTTTLKGSGWLETVSRWIPDLGNPFDALINAGRKHRQIDELSKLDNHLLEDIGLTRGDMIVSAQPDNDLIVTKLCNMR